MAVIRIDFKVTQPENQALWTRVGDALLSLERIDDAIAHYEASLKNGPDVYSYLGIARARYTLGDLNGAREYCEQALSHDETNERVLTMLINIYDEAGDSAAADKAREKLAQVNN